VAEAITRVTLFVPGTPSSGKAWTKALGTVDVDVEWVENDGEFGKAFSFGTCEPDVVAAIDDAPGALVLHVSHDLREGRETIVSIVEKLRDTGALAVRIEQSKLGWDIATWLELFSSDSPRAWHRGAVVFLGGDDAMQSCGMHAFSLPDMRIALDGGDPRELQELATALSVYLLAEDPVFRSGHTFAPDRESPRRLVERWPDVEYPPDHACHNPYGVWRLGPPGGRAREMGEQVLVFMPALHVILTALEEKAGKPLTKKQVEAIRDEGVCIAMDPRDAQRFERERGYADLDPELVWEQWKLVRAAR
jgi:hypothetical protein